MKPYWSSDCGRYVLYHGDALEVLPGLEAGSVDGIVADPPYCSGGRQQAGARGVISKNDEDLRSSDEWFLGDNMGTDTYLWWMRENAERLLEAATPGSQCLMFTDWRQYSSLVTAFETKRWTLRSCVVWDKDRGGAMGSFWRNNHEFVAVFVKGKPRPIAHGSAFNTWRGSKPQGGEHPTEKPVALIEYLIGAMDGQTILDPFTGSGTTGVACVKTGRRFIGVEIDERYCEIAARRIEQEAAHLFAGVTP